MSLFVGQLSRDVRYDELKDLFEEFGELTRCELKTGTRADYAFLTFENERDAEDALHSLQGKDLAGSKLNIEWARGKRKNEVRKEITCYECGETGHFARNCRRKRYRSRSPPRYRNRSPRYRSRSPRYRSRSPRYRSRSPPRYRSRSPRRDYRRSRSPRRERESPYRSRSISPRSRSPVRSRSPRRERERDASFSPERRSPPVERKQSPIPNNTEETRTEEPHNTEDKNNLKRPLESPTGDEPPEKRMKVE